MIDGIGSDIYLGMPLSRRRRVMAKLARQLTLPDWVRRKAWVARSFKLSYALGTLQMNTFERSFPGSRFTDASAGRDAALAAPSKRPHGRMRNRRREDALTTRPGRRCPQPVIREIGAMTRRALRQLSAKNPARVSRQGAVGSRTKVEMRNAVAVSRKMVT